MLKTTLVLFALILSLVAGSAYAQPIPLTAGAIAAGSNLSTGNVTDTHESVTNSAATWMSYLTGTTDPYSIVVTGVQFSPSITLSGSGGGTGSTSGLFSQGAWFGSTSATNVALNSLSASNVFSAPAANVSTLFLNQSVSGSSVAGQFSAITAQVNQTASSGDHAASVAQAEYVPFQSFLSLAHNEGGIGVGAGQSYGAAVGYDSNINLVSGATDFYALEGVEIGVTTATGSSVAHRAGIQIYGGAAVQGNLTDAGIDISSSGGADLGFKCGICFGKSDDIWPITSTGSIISTIVPVSGSQTAALGIDFSNVTFSTAFLKSTGFLVDGSGNVTGASYKAGATAGVSCAANTVSLTTLVVTNGIVTHC